MRICNSGPSDHRVAFLDFGPLTPGDTETELRVKATEQPGLHHVAFTFPSMGELLDNDARLRDRGIRPFFCVNHGPTTSIYYRDPDGNRIELQIDNSLPPKKDRRGCARRRSTRTRSASSTTLTSS